MFKAGILVSFIFAASAALAGENKLTIEKSYFSDDTVKARNECMEQIHAELYRQLNMQLVYRNMTAATIGAPTWLKTTGTIKNEIDGNEQFYYTNSFDVTKGELKATFKMDYLILDKVSATVKRVKIEKKVDELGNIVTPEKTVDRVEKFLLVVLSDNAFFPLSGHVDVTNAASGTTVFQINDPIKGSDEDRFGSISRMVKMTCQKWFAPYDIEVKDEKSEQPSTPTPAPRKGE